MFTCVPYGIAWAIVSMGESVYFIYASRILVGISHALVTTTVFTVEISSRDVRATFSLMEAVLR